MNTWTPLFSKIVDSSLWAEADYVKVVFITMLALKDADQVVRYSAFGLAQRAHKTEKEVLDALRILGSPDRKRLEPQPHEGRRIEKVDGGWKILNGQVYEDLMRSVNRRAYKAAKQREYRARMKRGEPLDREVAYLKAEERGEGVYADELVDGERLTGEKL